MKTVGLEFLFELLRGPPAIMGNFRANIVCDDLHSEYSNSPCRRSSIKGLKRIIRQLPLVIDVLIELFPLDRKCT